MKKALLATTAVVMSAGIAAADVTISGYGRSGIVYYEDGAHSWHGFTTPDGDNETQVVSRLRMNIDATTETDVGVEFGGRLRLQWDQNHGSRGAGASTNAGKLWVKAEGLTVEIGNVESAMETTNLFYASELGTYDRSVGGNMLGAFFAYNASRYDASPSGRVGYSGVGAIYKYGDANFRLSYIDPDQTRDYMDPLDPTSDEWEKELSLGVDYTWNDRLELAASAVFNGAGIDGHDIFFVGARYAVMDNARIGLNYYDNGDVAGGAIHGIRSGELGTGYDLGNTVTLYGDYTLADGLTNIEAYVANNDGDWSAKETDVAFGIGVNYDLGGARLGASVQRDYQERVSADMGFRFNF